MPGDNWFLSNAGQHSGSDSGQCVQHGPVWQHHVPGVVYDRHQNVAFFKGQATGQLVDTSRLCTSSNTTAWLSNIGK